MADLSTIKDRIAYAIEREGLSVGTFAKRCGVPDSTIRSLITKDRKPGFDLIVKMIETINRPWCDANWLVMGQEPASEDKDAKKLMKIISDQQHTIEEQRKRIDALTDRLLDNPEK